MARARSETHLARRFGDAADPDRSHPEQSGPVDLGRRPEVVLVEEPLEMRLDGVVVNTSMRTPGHDFELAVGWCHAEGLLDGASVQGIRYCATGSAVDTEFNVVTVETSGRTRPPTPRLTSASSSCGTCGVEDVERLVERLEPTPSAPTISADVMVGLTDVVAERQELFGRTGGSHAAAAVDAEGQVLVVREDIGRHNAVDKVVGRMRLDGALPASGLLLWVSGRASFEMVQKAWAAGFAALVSVSAPSSLAVRTAERAKLVLVGFARDGRCTVYVGADRVTASQGRGVSHG